MQMRDGPKRMTSNPKEKIMNLSKLIRFLVFLTQEPLTRKGGGRRRSGGPIGSSFPRHDVKERTKQTEKNQKGNKKNQGQTASLHKKNIEITILYDA